MSFTQPPKFPVLKEMLLLEDDEDIAAGIKQVLGDIRNKWGNSGRSSDKMRNAALKKLSPAQRAKVTEQVHLFFDSLLADISRPPNYQQLLRMLVTADEAVAVASVFSVIANPKEGKIQHIVDLFVNAAEHQGIIDTDVADRLRKTIRSDVDRPPSTDTVSFFKENATFFKRVLDLDEQLGIDADAGAGLLTRKLAATTDTAKGSRRDAVIRTVNGLQRIRLYCDRTVGMLKAEALARRPPKDVKVHPAVSDAHPAATAGGPTNKEEIISGLVNYGHKRAEVEPYVNRLPKDISTKDGITAAFKQFGGK